MRYGLAGRLDTVVRAAHARDRRHHGRRRAAGRTGCHLTEAGSTRGELALVVYCCGYRGGERENGWLVVRVRHRADERAAALARLGALAAGLTAGLGRAGAMLDGIVELPAAGMN